MKLSTHFKHFLGNASWFGFGRLFRLIINFIVGAWVARALGADNLGTIAHAQAIIAMLAAVAGLGIDSIAVREFRRSQFDPRMLATVFILRLSGGAICALLGGIAVYLFSGTVTNHGLLVFAILSLALPLQAFDAFDFWLQAQLNARGSVLARNVGSFTGSSFRIGAILSGGGVVSVAVSYAIESISTTGCFLWQCHRRLRFRELFHTHRELVYRLLSNTWPLTLSGISVALALQSDRLFLQQMLGSQQVGLYSAGARLSEIWYLIPMSLGAAALPTLVPSADVSVAQAEGHLRALYRVANGLTLSIAVVTTLFGSLIVHIVYGSRYAGADSVLAIHIWSLPFLSHVSIRNAALIAQGFEKSVALLMGMGAMTNILLNYLFIPAWRLQGAAVATVITWGLLAFVYPLMLKSTRSHVFQFFRSFSPS